ncbi:MAG: RagB/SusD family nutrient uptake outer membrane protein [Tannerella sp.]|jgi:hypothetical protein|nr:RagB/SusD family nutrient uptake outer membrane protein [Tannerella sp.]
MKKNITSLLFLSFVLCTGCGDYLDVIPDNIATIEHAFAMRSQAEKYLFTCYSYMPKDGNPSSDPAMEGGDEIWRLNNQGSAYFQIARGYQNITSPHGDAYWTNMYRALRDCNIFIENIFDVAEMHSEEQRQWAAEAMVLKAWYHFVLIRMYGAIPLIRENLPLDVGVDEVKVERTPVDECFNYIVSLIDEAISDLPFTTTNPQNDAGRITRLVAYAIKAKILLTAASPLYNGNTDHAKLQNHDGTPLFNMTVSDAKWQLAADACKEAIHFCDSAKIKLYYNLLTYGQYTLTDTIRTQLSLRNVVCERWNDEIIWANTQSYCAIQGTAIPNLSQYSENYIPRGDYSPTIKIAEQFYSDKGVPITEDKTWNYSGRYELRTGKPDEALYIREGYTTVAMHFNREPRFYSTLGFDGGVWYGQGLYDDGAPNSLYYLMTKRGQRYAAGSDRSTVTGYYIKKLIHFENVIGSGTTYSVTNYPWPLIRLADLYLMYAEALNELNGPNAEALYYVNLVRERAGLATVEESWTKYSINPAKYTNKEGLRAIIHQERLNELSMEGHRFWDLRRWKEAISVLNNPVHGWDRQQSEAAAYFRKTMLFDQTFGIKDYFWPIREANIDVNPNLVQNTGY